MSSIQSCSPLHSWSLLFSSSFSSCGLVWDQGRIVREDEEEEEKERPLKAKEREREIERERIRRYWGSRKLEECQREERRGAERRDCFSSGTRLFSSSSSSFRRNRKKKDVNWEYMCWMWLVHFYGKAVKVFHVSTFMGGDEFWEGFFLIFCLSLTLVSKKKLFFSFPTFFFFPSCHFPKQPPRKLYLHKQGVVVVGGKDIKTRQPQTHPSLPSLPSDQKKYHPTFPPSAFQPPHSPIFSFSPLTFSSSSSSSRKLYLFSLFAHIPPPPPTPQPKKPIGSTWKFWEHCRINYGWFPIPFGELTHFFPSSFFQVRWPLDVPESIDFLSPPPLKVLFSSLGKATTHPPTPQLNAEVFSITQSTPLSLCCKKGGGERKEEKKTLLSPFRQEGGGFHYPPHSCTFIPLSIDDKTASQRNGGKAVICKFWIKDIRERKKGEKVFLGKPGKTLKRRGKILKISFFLLNGLGFLLVGFCLLSTLCQIWEKGKEGWRMINSFSHYRIQKRNRFCWLLLLSPSLFSSLPPTKDVLLTFSHIFLLLPPPSPHLQQKCGRKLPLHLLATQPRRRKLPSPQSAYVNYWPERCCFMWRNEEVVSERKKKNFFSFSSATVCWDDCAETCL